MATSFFYNETHQVLICVVCKTCIKPSRASQTAHLRKDAHALTGPRIQTALATFATHPHINGPDTAPRPLTAIPPIPHLPLHQVYQCLLCNTEPATKFLPAVQSHISARHPIPMKDRQLNIHFRVFAAQTFFTEKKDIHYFEVLPDNQETSSTPARPAEVDFFAANRERRAKDAAARRDLATTIVGFGSHKSEVIPWAKTLGIEEHVRGLPDKVVTDSARLSKGLGANHCTWFPFIVQQTHAILDIAASFTVAGPTVLLSRQTAYLLTSSGANEEHYRGHHKWNCDISDDTKRKYYRYWADFVLYYLSVHLGHYCNEMEPTPHRYWWPDLPERPDGTSIPQDSIRFSAEERQLCVQLYDLVHAVDGTIGLEPPIVDQVHSLLVELFVLLLKTPTGPNNFTSTLVSFAALLSQQPSTKSWVEPSGLSHHLSGLIWVSQLLLFDSCRRACGDRVLDPDVLSRGVKELFDQVARQNRETPVGALLCWRDLLMAASKCTTQDRGAIWTSDGKTVTYDATSIHMDDVTRLIVHQYDLAHSILYNELLFGKAGITRLKADQFRDNSRDHADGVSLVDLNKDHVPLDPYKLEDVIEKCVRLRQVFVSSDGTSASWKEDGALHYETSVQAFLKHLLVIIHVVAGQPLRSPELLSTKWRNTQNRPRNIFVHDGRVMLRTSYHKGLSQTGKFKDNMRFLPRRVGELLLDFLVYVQPLRMELLRVVFPNDPVSAFLWTEAGQPHPWEDDCVTPYLKAACSASGVVPLNVRDWRQMTVAICKFSLQPKHPGLWEFDDDDEQGSYTEAEAQYRAIQMQRNHLPDTASRLYANQHAYGGLADEALQRSLAASTLWQDLFHVGGDLLGSSKRPREEEECDIADSPLAKRILQSRPRHRVTYTDTELTGKATELLGASRFSWRPGQLTLLRYILRGHKDIVAVLPTGAGKSLAFMLPSKLPEATTTVLVVPLVSLRVDMCRRLHDAGIDFSVWSSELQPTSRLVLVSVEAAVTTAFRSYLEGLHRIQRLDRVVIDECHLTVTAHHYRRAMADLSLLRYVGTQFVYLTATLPPSMELSFNKQNCLRKPHFIRQPTNRPNIRYSIRVNGEHHKTLLQAAAASIEQRHRSELVRSSYNPRSKVIVYCFERNDVRTLARHLGCPWFTSDSGTPAERQAVLDKWLRDVDKPYIVATSALGAGFDYRHIRTVWHIGPPRSMVDFAQESGRAGRDDEPASSIILLCQKWKADRSAYLPGSEGAAMLDYLEQDNQCLRVKLSKYLDGAVGGHPVCQTVHFACSTCLPALQGTSLPTPGLSASASLHQYLLAANPFNRTNTAPVTSTLAPVSFVSSRTLLPVKEDEGLDTGNGPKRPVLGEVSANRVAVATPTVPQGPVRVLEPPIKATTSPPPDHGNRMQLSHQPELVTPFAVNDRMHCSPLLQSGSSVVTSPPIGHSGPSANPKAQRGWTLALASAVPPSVESIDLTTQSSSPTAPPSKPVLLTSNPSPSSPSFASSALTSVEADRPPGSLTASSASSSTMSSGRAILLSEARDRQMLIDRFCEDLSSLRGTCAYCRALHRDFAHEFGKCQFKNEFLSAKQEYTKRYPKWLTPFTACYTCYLPQDICDKPAYRGHSSSSGSNAPPKPCRFPDTLLPWLFGTWQRDPDSLYFEFNQPVRSESEFFSWIKVREDVGRGKWTRGAIFMANYLSQHPL